MSQNLSSSNLSFESLPSDLLDVIFGFVGGKIVSQFLLLNRSLYGIIPTIRYVKNLIDVGKSCGLFADAAEEKKGEHAQLPASLQGLIQVLSRLRVDTFTKNVPLNNHVHHNDQFAELYPEYRLAPRSQVRLDQPGCLLLWHSHDAGEQAVAWFKPGLKWYNGVEDYTVFIACSGANSYICGWNMGVVVGLNSISFHVGARDGLLRVEGPHGFDNQNVGFQPPTLHPNLITLHFSKQSNMCQASLSMIDRKSPYDHPKHVYNFKFRRDMSLDDTPNGTQIGLRFDSPNFGGAVYAQFMYAIAIPAYVKHVPYDFLNRCGYNVSLTNSYDRVDNV